MFLLFWGVIFFFVRNVQNLTTIVVRLKTRRQLRRRIIRIKQRVCRIRVRTGWPRAFIVLSRFCFFPIRYVCKRVITYGFWAVGVFPFYHTPQQQVLSAYKTNFFFLFLPRFEYICKLLKHSNIVLNTIVLFSKQRNGECQTDILRALEFTRPTSPLDYRNDITIFFYVMFRKL